MVADISTYIRNVSISSTCAVSTWISCYSIRDICIRNICARNIFVRGVEPATRSRLLVKLGVTLADIRLNDYYLILFLNLIIASIDNTNHYIIDS